MSSILKKRTYNNRTRNNANRNEHNRTRRSISFNRIATSQNGKIGVLANNTKKRFNGTANFSTLERYPSQGPYENVPRSNLWWSPQNQTNARRSLQKNISATNNNSKYIRLAVSKQLRNGPRPRIVNKRGTTVPEIPNQIMKRIINHSASSAKAALKKGELLHTLA